MSYEELSADFLKSTIARFAMYRALGEGALKQLSIEEMQWTVGEESNSIATLLVHLRGNMRSRWVDFLTSDGEKADRERDSEFESPDAYSREELMDLWSEGWSYLENAVCSLTTEDLMKKVLIRNEPLSVIDAVHRQLGHVSYHVGQIVWMGKEQKQSAWKPLSIPKGQSKNVELIQSLGFGYRGKEAEESPA